MWIFDFVKSSTVELAAAGVCAILTWFLFAYLYPNEPLDVTETAFVLLLFFGLLKISGALLRRVRARLQEGRR